MSKNMFVCVAIEQMLSGDKKTMDVYLIEFFHVSFSLPRD